MERTTRSQHNEAALLPFSGLGIALSGVTARAACCHLIPIRYEKVLCSRHMLPDLLLVCNGYGSGFSLQIALGREIRGR